MSNFQDPPPTALDLGYAVLNAPPPIPHPFSNKLWNNSRTVYVKERNKNKIKANSRHIQLTTRSIVRFIPQTMQWYH